MYAGANGAEERLLLAYPPEMLGPAVCRSMPEAMSIPAVTVLCGRWDECRRFRTLAAPQPPRLRWGSDMVWSVSQVMDLFHRPYPQLGIAVMRVLGFSRC